MTSATPIPVASRHLKIALVQQPTPGQDPKRALQEGEIAVRQAAAAAADIVLFPEMWQIGYTACPDDDAGRQEWISMATDDQGEFVQHFATLARELGVAIVATYLQKWDPLPRNAATLIDRHGQILTTYAKIHTCDYWMEAALTPGQDLPVVQLDTAAGPVAVGMMICFDREFPETARILMTKGAELVLVPNACHLTDDRIAQFRTRAFENMMSVAMANYTSTSEVALREYPLNLNGRSVVYSGVCFEPDRTPLDPTLQLAEDSPGIYYADIDLNALRKFRASEVWGDAYRKPYTYDALVNGEIAPVFGRADSRRLAPEVS
ncbi:2-oxoglutaramate amidase [Rhodococcus erythropolis]|nr:2-oxoglutaramate amidase [Rhodococcus erythropolis]